MRSRHLRSLRHIHPPCTVLFPNPILDGALMNSLQLEDLNPQQIHLRMDVAYQQRRGGDQRCAARYASTRSLEIRPLGFTSYP